MDTIEKTTELQKISEEMQNRCQEAAATILKTPGAENIEYQDTVNAWMFSELAVLVYEIQELKKMSNGKS